MKKLPKRMRQLIAASIWSIQDEPDQARLRLFFLRQLCDPSTIIGEFSTNGSPGEPVSITVKIYPAPLDADWMARSVVKTEKKRKPVKP